MDKNNRTPIFAAVKATQTVFNGYGAQETCDMLVQALISPAMPVVAVCSDPEIWSRFETTVFEYQRKRIELATCHPSCLPYVSGTDPFRFNVDGHNRFLKHVSAYRRSYVRVGSCELDRMNRLNLLNPEAIIQNNGVGHSTQHYL